AVRYLRTRQDVDPARIGGIGLSVGGEMMLEAASKSRGVRAVVSEGAGERSINEVLDMTVGHKWLALPPFASLLIGNAPFSNKTPPPSLKDIVADIAPTPVLFIYGEHGQDGERNLNQTYYKAAKRPKAIWEVPGSGHAGGIDSRPKQYEDRVVSFFGNALLNKDTEGFAGSHARDLPPVLDSRDAADGRLHAHRPARADRVRDGPASSAVPQQDHASGPVTSACRGRSSARRLLRQRPRDVRSAARAERNRV